ncbi:hypothetical protein AB0D12_16660 [Streptomyces sp. NPDC048479]|uniref:hypothetical protein n=1 Tax=Streptomyces sp. NPDC048479 TaxID=3154725 RepID=UPI0034316E40
MGTAERRAAVERIKDAEAARDELRDTLAAVGVVLPSLGLDDASLARDVPRPLVDLGRCNPRVARQLAAILKGSAP